MSSLQTAKTTLSDVVARLRKCNNEESQCCRLLVQAQALLEAKTPIDTSEHVMSILESALTEVSTLQPMYTPPSPWNVPMPSSKPVKTPHTRRSNPAVSSKPVYQGYKNITLKPVKIKHQVEFNLDDLKQDVTLHINALLSHILHYMHPPKLTRSTPSQTISAQLRLMRACLDRHDFRRSSGI